MGHTDDSIEIFQRTLQITDEQLVLIADNFEVLYSRALALVGLWIAKDDATYYQQAFVAYQTAIKIGHAKGILLEKYQLLNALLACTDKDGTELLALLA
ncbi:MAG: hypothetical protein SH821_13230 [Phototrophicales bacterium]|nr:hypothetical protein [Phototrophicales bacterium]